ncbi:MAG: transporter [Paucimonas sp.]|nr:transporter [Paucimonas sp.]
MHRFPPFLQLIVVAIAAHAALAGGRVTTTLYALSLHASPFSVGVLIGLIAFFPMLLAVPLGRLVDRVGFARPMALGCLLILFGCGLPAVIPGVVVLYAAVILFGTGFTAVHIAVQHAVGVMSNADNRATNFSWLSAGFSVSSFAGPVLAGLLIDHASYAAAYAAFGLSGALGLALVGFGHIRQLDQGRAAPQKVHGSALRLLLHADMRPIYFIGILLAAAWDLFTFVIPLHGARLGFSASTIGLILGTFAVATFTVRLGMPMLARYYSEWQVLTGALALAVLCYLLFPFMHQPLAIMAVSAALGVALGATQPNVLALLHHAAPPGRGGEAIGIRATIGNASQVLLPVAFGAAGAALGIVGVFWGIAAMLGFGVPVAWKKAKDSTGEADD